MLSTIDHEGDERSHGWTKQADGTTWYWSVDHADHAVEFTDRGQPTDHPHKRTGEVPDAVRKHAERHVEALLDREQIPHH